MRAFKIIISIIFGIIMLLLLISSAFINAILFFIILALIIAINVGVSESYTSRIKILAVSILIFIGIIYIVIPKKTTGCGVLSNGLACSSKVCIGIPTLIGIPPNPGCIGVTTEVTNYQIPSN